MLATLKKPLNDDIEKSKKTSLVGLKNYSNHSKKEPKLFQVNELNFNEKKFKIEDEMIEPKTLGSFKSKNYWYLKVLWKKIKPALIFISIEDSKTKLSSSFDRSKNNSPQSTPRTSIASSNLNIRNMTVSDRKDFSKTNEKAHKKIKIELKDNKSELEKSLSLLDSLLPSHGKHSISYLKAN